jgi:glycine cleavage system H protein
MHKVPEDLRYTSEHEWIRVEGELGRIGITDFAQHELGDVVYVELPATGTRLAKGERFGTIESVKAASDLFAPAGGEVVEINAAVQDAPETVNDDPYGGGWMLLLRLEDPAAPGGLMDAAAYRAHIEQG